EKTRTGDIISRLTNDIAVLQIVIGSSLSVALRNIVLLIGGIILLIATSPVLTFFVLLILPIVLVPIIILGKKVRLLSNKTQEKISLLSNYIEESVVYMKTVQAYVRENIENIIFQDVSKNVLSASLAKIKVRALLTALVIMIVFSAVGFILWFGGHKVIDGEISPGQLASFMFYSILVAAATGAISEVIGDIQRAAGATERLLSILNVEAEIPLVKQQLKQNTNISSQNNPEEKNSLKSIKSIENFTIEFDIEKFSYPSRPEHDILKNLQLTIEHGSKVALVGVSGSGKTTILNLLLRFYNFYEGNIKIGDNNIKNFDVRELRNLFAIVHQEPVIFSGTIRDNINYGNINATDTEIIEAAKLAMAFNFIEKLPQGLDSYVGEKGIRLSGGQKQRITIARAILKNPAILLLDEATSALDSENEALVQQALDNLMQDRTTIIIAHRLATINKADKIIVIDQGTVHSSGNHVELMEKKDLYYKLANMQFLAS
ncbi:MAG: ABC transporter transmembrane domain-containing protein, partial [Pseudomonadota bacterium]